MRYYFINSDGREVKFDVAVVDRTQAGMIGFDIITEEKKQKKYFVKSLSNKNYLSVDALHWKKLPLIGKVGNVVNANETFGSYRGFKPSGLFSGSSGDLKTDMPGKVVKVFTTEGAVVNEGDTLLILEAMKMENEIRAGISGVVKAVHVEEGQALEAGYLMLEIEE